MLRRLSARRRAFEERQHAATATCSRCLSSACAESAAESRMREGNSPGAQSASVWTRPRAQCACWARAWPPVARVRGPVYTPPYTAGILRYTARMFGGMVVGPGSVSGRCQRVRGYRLNSYSDGMGSGTPAWAQGGVGNIRHSQYIILFCGIHVLRLSVRVLCGALL